MAHRQTDAIEIRQCPGKGLGVFALRPFREDEVIERVPVIVVPEAEVGDIGGWTGLAGYCFHWGPGKVALALGYGSLYNHSTRPNARYDDTGRRTKVFTAIRDIEKGEEITVSYNGDPDDDSPVGFKVVETPVPKRPVRSTNGRGRTGR